MPVSWYSTGSSIVTILSSIDLISESAAYSVVVLPLPVGPVTRTMPYGSAMYFRNRFSSAVGKPEDVEAQLGELLADRLLVENADDRVLAVDARHDRDAEVDRLARASAA